MEAVALALVPPDDSDFVFMSPINERCPIGGGGGGGKGGVFARGKTVSFGGGAASTINVAGKKVTVELSNADRRMGNKLVHVNTAKFDQAFARDKGFYVGRGGKLESGETSGRYGRFQGYLASNSRMEASTAGVQANGRVGFDNGRHRFAVLRDAGVKNIPVAMDKASIANAARHGYLDLAKADWAVAAEAGVVYGATPSDRVANLNWKSTVGRKITFAGSLTTAHERDDETMFRIYVPKGARGSDNGQKVVLPHNSTFTVHAADRYVDLIMHR
jgi:hypothetical protein